MTNLEIIKSFNQGAEGNCVCVAIIKAGIEVFGLDNIFSYPFIDNSTAFRFMMRDGFEAEVSEKELAQATAGSKFRIGENQKVLDYANICFAVMAKRAMIEGNDDTENPTYQQAIDTLNDGEHYLHGPNWLGLRHNFRYIGRKYARNNPGCVGASKVHCFYVSNGWEDKFGTPDRISLFERRFAHWFRLTTDQIF